MKYNIGDYVTVKNIDWYNENKNKFGDIEFEDINFIEDMIEYCGNTYRINNLIDGFYKFEDNEFCFSDDMLEDYKKNLILLIDPQVDFLDKDGSLYVDDNTEEKINLMNSFLMDLKPDDNSIAVSLDSHPENHSSFKIFPRHCVRGLHGHSVIKSISETLYGLDYTIIEKGGNINKEEFSPIPLMNELSFKYYENIYILGVAGDYCVYSTICDLIKLGFKDKIIVVENAIPSLDKGEKLSQLIKDNNLKTHTQEL